MYCERDSWKEEHCDDILKHPMSEVGGLLNILGVASIQKCLVMMSCFVISSWRACKLRKDSCPNLLLLRHVALRTTCVTWQFATSSPSLLTSTWLTGQGLQ